MRKISHWSPKYISNRILIFFYQNKYPENPWLTPKSVEILESCLKDTDIGLEFGSGRSTTWLSKRVGQLTSIEHNKLWFDKVYKTIEALKLDNVNYHLLSPLEDDMGKYPYLTVLESIGDNSLDFCLVDGLLRDHCTIGVIDKIKPGGLLIIDDVNRYFPSRTDSPFSRKHHQGPMEGMWTKLYDLLQNWRCIWTSSGISDTAIFIKPCTLYPESGIKRGSVD